MSALGGAATAASDAARVRHRASAGNGAALRSEATALPVAGGGRAAEQASQTLPGTSSTMEQRVQAGAVESPAATRGDSMTAAPLRLPAPLSQLPLPLASLVGTSPAARAAAEDVCQRSNLLAQQQGQQASPDHPTSLAHPDAASDAADVLRRALAVVRRAGGEGVSRQALASELLSPGSSSQSQAPHRQPVAAAAQLPSAGAGAMPLPGRAAAPSSGAPLTALPPPAPAALAAATAALRALLRHGLVRRVPGFTHVAYVASEHSQRYLLLPPFPLADAVPRPPPFAVPGGPAAVRTPSKGSVSGAAPASADAVPSAAAGPPPGGPHRSRQAAGAASLAEGAQRFYRATAQHEGPPGVGKSATITSTARPQTARDCHSLLR